MLIKSYLSNKKVILLLGLTLLVWYWVRWHWSLLIAISLAVTILFFYRKKRKIEIIRDRENGILFSPIEGVVKEVEETAQYKIIHMRRAIWEEWGLYMPSCGKIREVQIFEGKNSFLLQNFHHYTDFQRMLFNIKTSFGQYDLCILGQKFNPIQYYVEGGDYAFSGARFAHKKGGVDLLLFLPKDFSIVVKNGEVLNSHKSIIAVNTLFNSEKNNKGEK